MHDETVFSPRQADRRQNPRRVEDIRRKEACERAVLLAQSLIGTNYQNRTEKEGIRHFIGCLQLVLQEPLGIVLLRKDKLRKNTFLVLYHTLLDPLVKDYFEAYLHREFDGYIYDHNLYLPSASLEKKRFNLHTDYFVVLFRLLNFEREFHRPCEFECIQSHHNDGELDAFLNYFSRDSHMLSQFVSDGLGKEFDRRGGKQFWFEGRLYLKEQQADLDFEFLNSNKMPLDYPKFFAAHFKKISRIFNRAYEEIRDSALLRSNRFQPPNIMFALRLFDRQNARNSDPRLAPSANYPYGIRGLLPAQQKADIVAALETLRRVQRDPRFRALRRDSVAERFYFPKPALRELHYEQLTLDDFPAGGNAYFGGDSEFFWDLVESEQSFEVVCEELEQAYGDHSRALSDSVFCSGFVSVAQNPYVKARAMRLSPQKWMTGAKDIDYRRLVYYHYLMSMAAQGAGSMSALVVPGRVSGSVWFTMGYYFTDQEPEHKRWLNCYHFYHNVAAYFTRSIRSSAKRLYLKELKNLFFKLIDDVIPATYPALGVEKFPQLINAYFVLLCRVYPFVLVQLKHVNNDEPMTEPHVFSQLVKGGVHVFSISLDENPFFESTTNAAYITPAEIIDTLSGLQGATH